jgi:hypothetical protein
MDETGIAVGETQSTRIIVDSTMKSNWKITAGKQEWITVLECIDADGGALPPMIIFKAKTPIQVGFLRTRPQIGISQLVIVAGPLIVMVLSGYVRVLSQNHARSQEIGRGY